MKKIKRHRTVEIYFILYLAAIIFLLPDKKSDILSDPTGTTVLQGPFSLQPVKTSMTCRFFIDSNGLNILSIDSMNTIVLTGDVEDVNFRIEVEDLSVRQKQTITGSSKYFRYEEDDKRQELKFFWKPPDFIRENKNYNITIIATAREKDLNNINPENSTIYRAETQFSLIMTNVSDEYDNSRYTDPLYATGKQIIDNQGLIINNVPYFNNLNQEINIEADSYEVQTLAYKSWTNSIIVWGVDPSIELKQKPTIKVIGEYDDNAGTAFISSIDSKHIQITGKAPSYGKMKVFVDVVFNRDKKKRSIEFDVSAIRIASPIIDKVMYPDKNYTIKPNLPMLNGQETQAYIKNKNDMLMKSEQGEPLNFKPEISQIGYILTLERWVDNNLYDKTDFRIQDYPDPIIINDFVNDNQTKAVTIITRSYGYFNGEKNLTTLDVDGNVIFRDQRGKMKENNDDIIYFTQQFLCEPKDKNKPFVFNVKAVDKRNRSSQKKSYSP